MLLGPVGKELLKAAAAEGLEAFLGGAEHAAAKEAAEKSAQEQGTRDIVRTLTHPHVLWRAVLCSL